MTLRKIGSILLVVAMLTSFFASAAGAQATAEAREAEVLAVVRTRIGDTSRYTEFESSSRTAKNGVITYRFEWYTEQGDDYAILSVSCTSGGVITEYYLYDSATEMKYNTANLDKMPRAEAMEKAKVLMDKLNPQLSNVLVLSESGQTESVYDTGHVFPVSRMENGLLFYGQTGSVSVNATADVLESFYINYDETLVVPEKQSLISKAEAEATYAELLGMKLVYKSYTRDGERTIYPVYVPASASYMYVDATKYRAVLDMRSASGGDKYVSGVLGDSAAGENDSMDSIEFTEAELAELAKVEGLADSNAVLESLLKNTLLDIPENPVLMRTARNKDVYADAYTYSYYIKGDSTSANITADAKTGALLSYSTYRASAAEDETDTTALAKAAAEQLCGNMFGEYRPDEAGESKTSVRYYRYVNNVPYYNDSIYVSVHPKSGKVTNFSATYTDAEFPSVEGVLNPVQAAEALFARVNYTPQLMARYDEDGVGTVQTVYVLEESKPTSIEPFTGALLQDYSNEPYTENVWNGYTDIEGHYAQKQIETLARFGIRFADETCKPDAVITQAEFVSLLANAFYDISATVGTEVDFAYRLATNNGILSATERADDVPLTRLSAAVYMIRAMGLDEVASLEGIYVCPFNDVTENIGHVSLLGAMGVVRGDGAGSFNPGEALTRADAAILIYNYLSR